MLTICLVLAFAALSFAQSETSTETTTVTDDSSTTVYTTMYESTSYPEPTSTSTSTSSAPAATYTILVGPNNTLTFSPNNITANVGDTIQYFFNPKNHTVTQSSFANPCKTLEDSTGVAGFDSGFGHNTNVSETLVGFSFAVNDTEPIWVFCAQTVPESHCRRGMVSSINAPTTGNNTFADFLGLATSNSSSSATSSGTPIGTTTGTATSATPSSTNSSAAIYTSVNVGLTTLLAFVGVVIFAL